MDVKGSRTKASGHMDKMGSAQVQDLMGRAVETGALPYFFALAFRVGHPSFAITPAHMGAERGSAPQALW